MNDKNDILRLIDKAILLIQNIVKEPEFHDSEKYALTVISYWKECYLLKKKLSIEEFENANLGLLVAKNIEDYYPELADLLYRINMIIRNDLLENERDDGGSQGGR